MHMHIKVVNTFGNRLIGSHRGQLVVG